MIATCWPVFLNELFWVTGISLYKLVHARIGTEAIAAVNIVSTMVWCIGLPIAFFSAFYLKLPVYWVMALIAVEEIYRLGIGIPRFLSKKWIRNLVAA